MFKTGPFWRQIDFFDPKIIIFWALECLQCTLGNNSHGIDDENVFINDFCNQNMPLTGVFWSKWPEMAKNVYFSTWERRHISKIYYIRMMKILLKSLYDTSLWANVPFYNQKCNFRCSRDLNLCDRRKNGPKWPFWRLFESPPARGEQILVPDFF